jgi:outer membrane protein assembly factor BamB
MRRVVLALCLSLVAGLPVLAADPTDEKYPLGDQMRVLADDVESPSYRKLIDTMLLTDLAAEWQRVETLDNAEAFLEGHGGRERVLADPALKQAYERRVEIQDKFLDLMRIGFKRFNKPAPFDQGLAAEKAATVPGKATRQPTDAVQLSVVRPAPGSDDQWPRFRGPDAQGHSLAKGLPIHWSSSENILWRTPLAGSGNSSPIIWGERIFLTSSGEEGRDRSLMCLNRADGKLLWTRTLPKHEVEPNVREKNGFASATPATDGERVVAFFGSGGLVCYDFAGRELWQHALPTFNTTWGTGSSPLVYGDSVILVQDQNKADSVFVCVDKKTGKLRWKQPRGKAMGWSTPVVVHVGDHDELIYPGGETIKGYDPATGEELWTMSGPTREVVPGVLVGQDLIYTASGRQGPTLGLRPGGHGDVSETHLVWRTPRGGPHVPSPIYYDGRIYSVNDTGIATCLDATDGKLLWQARIRDKFSASPIEAEGLLYFASESGVTYVLRAGERFEQLAANDLGSPILASPAALGDRLYLRTAAELVCIGKQP